MDLTSRSPKLLRVLALVAMALGFLAIFAGSPSRTTVSMDMNELAAIIENEEDHVTPGELAAMIMASSEPFRIIDVRDSASFANYHIPGAERFDLPAIVREPFKPLETLVLYSQGGTHASQGWFLLKARGLRAVYTLRGGLDLWNDAVLHPSLPTDAPLSLRDSIRSIAEYFGGALANVPRALHTPSGPPGHPLQSPPVKRERERTRDGC